MYGIIKISLVVFVQPLSTGNLMINYGVPDFGRFLKNTWDRYGKGGSMGTVVGLCEEVEGRLVRLHSKGHAYRRRYAVES